jgi:tight adherence protein B
MTQRFPSALVACLAVVAFGATPAFAADGSSLDVVSVQAAGDGTVKVVVAPPPTLAGRDLTEAPWRATVGDRAVDLDVAPVSNDHLEVVLALDTSGSMQGLPLAAAKAAATSFVRRLPPLARLAVVGFSSRPTVLLPLSVDRDAAVAAIAGVPAQGETALYDGVVTAARAFSADATARRSMVVLSDGGDTVSSARLADAITAVTGARATGYVASLVTPDSDEEVLRQLAAPTGGQVVSATDATAIQRVFDDIAATLTNQYQLRFTTAAHGQATLAIQVDAGGQFASVERLVELRPRPVPARPAARVVDAPDREWMRFAGLLSVAGGLLVLGMLVFAPRRRRLRPTWGVIPSTAREHSIRELTQKAATLAEDSLRRRGFSQRIDTVLEQAGIPLRPGEVAMLGVGAVLTLFFLGAALFGLFGGLVFAAAAALGVRTVIVLKVTRRRALFAEQLSDTLQLLAGGLRSGYGLLQAMDAVAKNAEAPTSEEFGRLVMETRVGRSVPEALAALARRVGSQDFDWVVDAMAINREVGGDLTELLDRAGATIRERDRVRRQIKALSAEGRLSAVVLIALPILLFLYMRMVNPDYIGELTGSGVGLALLTFACGMLGAGALWLRRLVRVVF